MGAARTERQNPSPREWRWRRLRLRVIRPTSSSTMAGSSLRKAGSALAGVFPLGILELRRAPPGAPGGGAGGHRSPADRRPDLLRRSRRTAAGRHVMTLQLMALLRRADLPLIRFHDLRHPVAGGVRLSTVATLGSGQLRWVPVGLRVRMRVQREPRRERPDRTANGRRLSTRIRPQKRVSKPVRGHAEGYARGAPSRALRSSILWSSG